MKIERAIREKTFTLTSIAGPSGSGKTYSAILYARGLVGPGGKIGFIDTENKRSRFYADVAGGFDVIDLDPPFTSHRYVEAIKAFEAAGYTAIIIDSISHEWEGTGGVLEQAEAIEQKTSRAGLHCWQKPKAAHKKLMNELLQTRAHLIFCCRVKEKVAQVKGANGKTEIVNEGFVVVQEKSFIYEMTVSMMLAEGTHIPTIQKCPGDLLSAFPEGRKVSPDVGGAVREWSDQGVAIDEELEAAKREGVLAANNGMTSLLNWWSGLGGPRQTKLANLKDTLKSIAQASDQMKADLMDAGGGDPGERLSHRREQSTGDGSGEGFDLDSVKETLRAGATEQHSSAPPPADDDTGSGVSPSSTAPGSPSEPEPNSGNGDGAEQIEAAQGDVASSVPSDDKALLLRIYSAMQDCVGPSVEDFNNAFKIFDGELAGASDAVKRKAETIRTSLEFCCGDDPKRTKLQARSYLAGVIGVEEGELP
ncbi:AAA family ATPase [Mesorhizobium sp. CAU 1741]|uniref:AAA family ATPase n=1 Tax=Mesorhizobium sp. CAU 1741 TaxID=3140366 RepID=UPI00325AAEC4